MRTEKTSAAVSSDTAAQTNAAGQKDERIAGEHSIVVGASISPELSNLGFSFDTSSVDVAPPLTAEQLERFKLLKEASRYISNKNPAESLENFPERGELGYRQLSLIKLYNETVGTSLPVSETIHSILGGDKGILKALVEDTNWDAVREQPTWKRYLDCAEARMVAKALENQLIGKVVTETDLTFRREQTYTVTRVTSEGTMINILGIGPDHSQQSWEGDLKVLTTSNSGGQLFISNRYGSSLVADLAP